MSIFSSTAFYNIQPPSAAGPAYSVRTDSSGSFVQLAVPGTNFGSVFEQTNFQNDISKYVRGSGANVTLIVTSSSATNVCIISSSLVNSGSYNFSTAGGYSTSVFQEDAGSIGAVFGTTFSDFTSTDWVVECWLFMQERLASPLAPFHKSLLRNTNGTFSCDMSFPSNQPNSPLFRLRWIRGTNQYFSGDQSYNLNVWYHCAFAFTTSTNTITAYWAGQRITNTASTSGTITSNLWYRVFGGDMGANDGAKGSIQDYRVTIGSNRGYTGTTITPPNSMVILN
jgi:hypothetical protein